jgi:chromosome partitioning protein
MKVIALYNMKGGVGKTTAAVNLSYLAAAAGQRTLLWDLDPQAASSFAFRIRPRVEGFGKKSLECGEALGAAVKETDYHNLDLLPADFGYRKLDRLLGDLSKPKHVVTALLEAIGRDYDVVFLDCPAGFSLLTEGILAKADAVVVPTIPTVLSLRTLAQLTKWADRSDSPSELAAFFSMVDRRKALHRCACEWAATGAPIFLAGQVPYASVVEQMAIRRMPLPVFAARDAATVAFEGIWSELQTRLQQRAEARPRPRGRWVLERRAIESLIARLEPAEASDTTVRRSDTGHEKDVPAAEEVHFVHRFDTDGRDLRRCGYVLELHERAGSFTVVAARSSLGGDRRSVSECAEVQVDASWATQILSGAKSPLAVLERRLRPSQSWLLQDVRANVGGGRLRRLDSGIAERPADVDRSVGNRPVTDAKVP